MARRMEVEVEGARARFTLLDFRIRELADKAKKGADAVKEPGAQPKE